MRRQPRLCPMQAEKHPLRISRPAKRRIQVQSVRGLALDYLRRELSLTGKRGIRRRKPKRGLRDAKSETASQCPYGSNDAWKVPAPPVSPFGSDNSPHIIDSPSELTGSSTNSDFSAQTPGLAPQTPTSESQNSSSSASSDMVGFMLVVQMDPLWSLTREQAHDLLDLWFDGPGLLYPIVTREKMVETCDCLFELMGDVRLGNFRDPCAMEALFSHDTKVLKLVLGISCILEARVQGPASRSLLRSATETLGSLIWTSPGIQPVEILVLLVGVPMLTTAQTPGGHCSFLTTETGNLLLPDS